MHKAINRLKSNKAVGMYQVPDELLKCGKDITEMQLTCLFNPRWNTEDVPPEWRHGVIVPLPKKDTLTDCKNWQGITLLSVTGKVFCSVLLSRLKKSIIDQTLHEEQESFHSGRSCTEHISTRRNITEQCQNWKKFLYVNYIDFKKASESIHQNMLRKILKIYGISDKYINIFWVIY